MNKRFVLLSVSALAAGLLWSSALASDNCGHGYHWNYGRRCVSNYGRTSGCPREHHLGWNVERCVPDW
jgi:hypothetical protein